MCEPRGLCNWLRVFFSSLDISSGSALGSGNACFQRLGHSGLSGRGAFDTVAQHQGALTCNSQTFSRIIRGLPQRRRIGLLFFSIWCFGRLLFQLRGQLETLPLGLACTEQTQQQGLTTYSHVQVMPGSGETFVERVVQNCLAGDRGDFG